LRLLPGFEVFGGSPAIQPVATDYLLIRSASFLQQFAILSQHLLRQDIARGDASLQFPFAGVFPFQRFIAVLLIQVHPSLKPLQLPTACEIKNPFLENPEPFDPDEAVSRFRSGTGRP